MAAAIFGNPDQRMRHAHLLAGRAQVQAALEVQPVRAGGQLAVRPAVAPIELGDQREPAIIGGIQVSGEFGDLRFEFFEGTGPRQAMRHRPWGLLELVLYPVLYQPGRKVTTQMCEFLFIYRELHPYQRCLHATDTELSRTVRSKR